MTMPRAWTGIALLAIASATFAQQPMPTLPVSTAQHAEEMCAPCHGRDGNSVRGDIPILAGQAEAYLERQLHAFAAQGEQRANGVMGAIAVDLSEVQMKRLANYFAHQTPRSALALEVRTGPRGERIYFEGIASKHVTSCASCHGVRGQGLPGIFPRLSGQHAAYLAAQLRYFRSGRRTSDPQAMMRDVAGPMSDSDIDAVAGYLAHER